MFKSPAALFYPEVSLKSLFIPLEGKKTLYEQTDALITPERNPEGQGRAFRTESARDKQKQKRQASSEEPGFQTHVRGHHHVMTSSNPTVLERSIALTVFCFRDLFNSSALMFLLLATCREQHREDLKTP